MSMPGYTAEASLRKTEEAYSLTLGFTAGKGQVLPQLFDPFFFAWCVWTFGEWGACWRASQ